MKKMILLSALLLGACSSTPPEPRRPSRDRAAARTPGADLTEVNRVYRMAALLRARTLGQPRRVVLAGGVQAWTVQLQQTRWLLRQMEQSAVRSLERRTRYMKLPEPERSKHMRRVDNHLQLWWVPKARVTDPAALKKSLTPTAGAHNLHRELAYLGTDARVAWFAYAPIPVWLKLQKSQSLTGGDKRIPALIRGLTVKDPHEATALGCYYLLAKVGLKARAQVEELVRTKHPARKRAVFALGRERGADVLTWLLKMVVSPDPVVAFQARRRILYPPRSGDQAKALYLKWLGERAGTKTVWRELRACDMLEIKEAAPLLPKVLARPFNLREYRQAFVLGRKLAGKPLPEALKKDKQRIIKAGLSMGDSRKPDQDVINYAVSRFLRSKDRAAAAQLALDLALFVSKGNYEAARAAGVKILKRLRRRAGRKLVRRLAKTVQDPTDRQTLGQLLARMRKR